PRRRQEHLDEQIDPGHRRTAPEHLGDAAGSAPQLEDPLRGPAVCHGSPEREITAVGEGLVVERQKSAVIAPDCLDLIHRERSMQGSARRNPTSMARLLFLTSTPPTVAEGSGTWVGISVLRDAIIALGHEVAIITPPPRS